MILKNNIILKQKDFKNEKELQTFFEKNIYTILGYKFIDTEFSVGNFRIDTLAFDEETKSFKIIEYKNVKNHSLGDQGYAYLNLLLERKADFVLKYNNKNHTCLTLKDIDWSQSRVIFVSPIFTKYQLIANNFKNMQIDLIKITRYQDNIIDINFIEKTSNVKVQELSLTNDYKKVNKEVVVYTEEDHLNKVPSNIKELYETLKERVLELDDIDVDVKKVYIAFKGKTNIIDVELYQKNICVTFNVKRGFLNDQMHIAEDISNIGHHGNGDYRVFIKNEDDIDDIIPLVKQSLKYNKK